MDLEEDLSSVAVFSWTIQLTSRTVTTNAAVLVSLAEDTSDGGFCCGAYNTSNSLCINQSGDSNRPFGIDRGLIIVNRTDGTTWYGTNAVVSPLGNDTLEDGPDASVVTVQATVTAPAEKSNIAPVAAGIAVPLGVLLLAALAAAGVFWKKTRDLKREVSQLSAREHSVPGYSSNGYQPVQTQHGTYNELNSEGRHILEADGRNEVKELPSTRQ